MPCVYSYRSPWESSEPKLELEVAPTYLYYTGTLALVDWSAPIGKPEWMARVWESGKPHLHPPAGAHDFANDVLQAKRLALLKAHTILFGATDFDRAALEYHANSPEWQEIQFSEIEAAIP